MDALLAALDDPDVAAFVAFLRLKNLSAATMVGYLSRLKALAVHSRGSRSSLTERSGEPLRRSLRELRTADLRIFVAGLQSRDRKPATVASYVSTIKRFYGFLQAEGIIDSDPSRRIPRPKEPRYLPKALTMAQTRRLFDTLDDAPPRGLRDKTLIVLQYACALRLSEVISVRLQDLDLPPEGDLRQDGTLRVVGKGDRERRLFLKPQIVALLQQYIETCGIGDYLFPSPHNDHLSGNRANKILKEYARQAGLPDTVTSHTLRHSCATHYLLGGAPITFVQQLLGHASLKTTGRYTALVDEVAREIATTTELVSVPSAALRQSSGERSGQGLGLNESEKKIRESRAPYSDWDFEDAAWHVEKVLVWLCDV